MDKYTITAQRLMQIVDRLSLRVRVDVNEWLTNTVRDYLTGIWWDDINHQKWLNEGSVSEIVDSIVFAIFETKDLRLW